MKGGIREAFEAGEPFLQPECFQREDGDPGWQEMPGWGAAELEPDCEAVAAERKLLPLIDMTRWAGAPPPRVSLWGDWLPAKQTTMLTGRGGIGKSLFEQALCTAIALGRPFLGMETTQKNALYATCEDEEEELWRRQDAICEAFGVTREAVLGKLFLCSLTGQTDTALATFDESGRLVRTDRWGELEYTCEAMEIGLYAFDNATDAMAGDLNDLHQVAEFVNLLTGLAIRQGGAAMILHHPNKAGDDWLGSVAWHNKVRSRLIIEDGDDEGDPDGRVIRNPKANYGPQGGKIAFRWHRGAFVRTEDLPADYAAELSETIKISGENEAFLACLRARAAQGEGRLVGPAPGPNYAPTQFEGMPEAKGYRKVAFKRAMDRLFGLGAIEAHTYRNKAKGRDVTIIREPPEPTPNAYPERFPNTVPERPRTPPRTAPRTHCIDKSITGAADGAAAPDDDGLDWGIEEAGE